MTLTQAAVITKRVIFFSAIFTVLSISGYVGYRIWYANYLASLPPPEIKPDQSFGKLPPIALPPTKVSSANFSYSIDTETGKLPQSDKLIKVYFMPKGVVSLLSAQKAQELATKLHLLTQPEILTETRYRFASGSAELNIDIDTGNFIYTNRVNIADQTISETDEVIISSFKKILSDLELLREGLENGTSKVKYLKLDGEKLATSSAKEAQAAQVLIWPSDLDGKPIIMADYTNSLIKGTFIEKGSSLENYQSINYTFWPIDTTTSSTYYLKPAEDALTDLRAGRGAIIIEPTSPQISITSITLAYYQPESYTPYLQPIYVFEGPSFVALIDAIKR